MSKGAQPVCSEDQLWKQLYHDRWGALLYLSKDPLQRTARQLFRQRHLAEATSCSTRYDPSREDLPDESLTFVLTVKNTQKGQSVFEGSSTIVLKSSDVRFELAILNNLDQDDTLVTDDELCDGLQVLRGTLLVHRASDCAMACIWGNLPVDEDSLDSGESMSFGHVDAWNNEHSYISCKQ